MPQRGSHHVTVSGDTLQNNSYGGSENVISSVFDILSTNRKRAFGLHNDQQFLGKKLRVGNASDDNDGLVLGSNDIDDTPVDFFQVLRSGTGSVLRLTKQDGQTGSTIPSVVIDLNAETADFTKLTLNSEKVVAAEATINNLGTSGGNPVFHTIKVYGRSNYLNSVGESVSTGYVLGDACTRGVAGVGASVDWNDNHKLATADGVHERFQAKSLVTQANGGITTGTDGNAESDTKYPSVYAMTAYVAANAGGAGFDVTASNPGVIDPNLDDNLTTNQTVGNYASGTSASTLKEKSFRQLMSGMFFTEQFPRALTNPSCLDVDVPTQSNAFLKVGDSFPNDTVHVNAGRWQMYWLTGNQNQYCQMYGHPTSWKWTFTVIQQPGGTTYANDSGTPFSHSETQFTIENTDSGQDNIWRMGSANGTATNGVDDVLTTQSGGQFRYYKTFDFSNDSRLKGVNIGIVTKKFEVTLPFLTNTANTASPPLSLQSSFGTVQSGYTITRGTNANNPNTGDHTYTASTTVADGNNSTSNSSQGNWTYWIAPAFWGYQTRGAPTSTTDETDRWSAFNQQGETASRGNTVDDIHGSNAVPFWSDAGGTVTTNTTYNPGQWGISTGGLFGSDATFTDADGNQYSNYSYKWRVFDFPKANVTGSDIEFYIASISGLNQASFTSGYHKQEVTRAIAGNDSTNNIVYLRYTYWGVGSVPGVSGSSTASGSINNASPTTTATDTGEEIYISP